jgi:hypothetical protein
MSRHRWARVAARTTAGGRRFLRAAELQLVAVPHERHHRRVGRADPPRKRVNAAPPRSSATTTSNTPSLLPGPPGDLYRIGGWPLNRQKRWMNRARQNDCRAPDSR